MYSTTMPSADRYRSSDLLRGQPTIRCEDCRSALYSDGRKPSFLLLDHLSIPVVGCKDHVDQFASICSLTTDDTADLLSHRPAGGIRCPGCRLAPHSPPHPILPVRDGATIVLACSKHQSTVVDRFRSGLRTRQQLTTDLETASELSSPHDFTRG